MKNENKFETSGYYYPVEKESQLINFIKSGNVEKAKLLIGEIIKTNSDKYHLSKAMFELLKYDVACTMTKIVCSRTDYAEIFPVEDFAALKRITQCTNTQALVSATNAVIDCISDNAHNSGKNEFIKKIIDYVETNYMLSDLSVSVIAECFNLNISYLSTAFKKQMGTGLSEYIQSVRINKAKELLNIESKKNNRSRK